MKGATSAAERDLVRARGPKDSRNPAAAKGSVVRAAMIRAVVVVSGSSGDHATVAAARASEPGRGEGSNPDRAEAKVRVVSASAR